MAGFKVILGLLGALIYFLAAVVVYGAESDSWFKFNKAKWCLQRWTNHKSKTLSIQANSASSNELVNIVFRKPPSW